MARFQAAAGLAAALFVVALLWALLRFGATETVALYLFFLILAALAALAGLSDRLSSPDPFPPVGGAAFAGLGGLLLAAVFFAPTLEARGYVFLAIGWLSFYLGCRIAAAGHGAARVLILGLVLLGAFEAAYGLFQALTGHDFIGTYARDLGRIASGTLINRNHFAGFLNLVLPLALAMLLLGSTRDRSPGSRTERLAVLWMGLLGAAMMALAVPLSLSRGGTIVLLVVVAYLAVLFLIRERNRRQSRLPRAGLWILLTLLLGFGSALGLDALVGRFSRIEADVTRLAVYRDTLDLIGDHPVRGVGPGMYRWRFRPYQTGQTEGWYEHAHNDYLETAAEWGLPIALLFWAGIGWLWWRGTRKSLAESRGGAAALVLGASASILSVLVHSTVDFILRTPVNWAVSSALLGVVWALTRPAETGRRTDRRVAAVIRLALALLLVAAGWKVVQRHRAAVLTDSAESVEPLERASILDPELPDAAFRRGLLERDSLGRPAAARRSLERAVELNPYYWTYRLELARTYELLGQEDLAESVYGEALELNPRSSFFLWSLANFSLRRGRLEQAVESAGRAVGQDRELMEAAYALLRRAGATAEQIAVHWPADRKARFGLLRFAIDDGSASPGLIEDEWRRLLDERPPVPIRETGFLFRHLLATGSYERARAYWIGLQRLHGTVDPAFETGENLVWNGGFEAEISDHPMDWRIVGSEHFRVRRVERGDGPGSALEVEFSGLENLDFSGVQQRVFVPPGAELELSCALQSEGITTDRGVYVRVVDSAGRELLATRPLLGTVDWQSVGGRFVPAAESPWITILLSRRASRRIDSRVAGAVWIDEVVVRAAGELRETAKD